MENSDNFYNTTLDESIIDRLKILQSQGRTFQSTEDLKGIVKALYHTITAVRDAWKLVMEKDCKLFYGKIPDKYKSELTKNDNQTLKILFGQEDVCDEGFFISESGTNDSEEALSGPF